MVTKTLGIKAEWDKLTKVLVHEPGYELHMAKRSKKHALFDIRPGQNLNINEAINEHRALVKKLEELGVEVSYTKDEFFKNQKSKDYVKKLYMKSEISANFEDILNGKINVQDIEKGIDADIDIIFGCSPADKTEVDYGKEYTWQEVLTATYSILDKDYENIGDKGGRKGAIFQSRPFNNYMFQRDQQFMTDKGYVICNMQKAARKGEPSLNELVLEQLTGQGPIHKISDKNTIEGGEYIPCGDFALIGCGERTSIGAIEELLAAPGAIGFDKIIVVKTPDAEIVGKKENMEIMHLDTYFNFAGKNAVIVQKDVANKTELTEYVRNENGTYTQKSAPVINGKECKTLADLIDAKKYGVIELTPDEQRYYGANILTIDENTVIVPDMEKNSNGLIKNEDYLDKFCGNEEKKIKGAGLKKEDIHMVVMKELTKVYGSIHCSICSLERLPKFGGGQCLIAPIERVIQDKPSETEQSGFDLAKQYYYK
jgi:arginine deiminase